MNNFYKIFKLIREDEEQERVNLDKFVKKQFKKNRNIITDEIMTMYGGDLKSAIEEIYYIDISPNKIYVSKMISLMISLLFDVVDKTSVANSRLIDSLFFKVPIIYRAYFSFLKNKSQLLEYSIPIIKMNQFDTFDDVYKWVLESAKLLKKRIKERKIKGRRDSDDNLKWGDYLIFENEKIGDSHFDCYLVSDFDTAETFFGGFATWCWSKQPGHWRGYTGTGVLFILENNDMEGFKIQSPPEKATQEKLIACHYRPDDGWGEINHLNNSTSIYANDVEENQELFIDGFEESTGLDISNFESLYEEDEESRMLDAFPGSEIVDGNKLIINDDISLTEENYIDYDDLDQYEIFFLGNEIYNYSETVLPISRAINIEEIDLGRFSELSIYEAKSIKKIELGGSLLLGSGVKSVDEIIFYNDFELDFYENTNIKKFNFENLSLDIFDLKSEGKGQIDFSASPHRIYLGAHEKSTIEIKHGEAVVEVTNGTGSFVVIPDVDDNKKLENLIIHNQNYETITTTMSMALEDKIDVNGLESLVKSEKIILLDDISKDYQPYEYDKSHWENGKFIFWGTI